MGNHHCSKEDKDVHLRHDEHHLISQYFGSLCKQNKDLCHKEFLEKYWKTRMDKSLCAILMKHLFQNNPDTPISLRPFLLLFGSLARSFPKTATDFMIKLMNDGVPLTYNKVLEYVKSIISSYIIFLTVSDHVILKSWTTLGFKTSSETCTLLAKSLCHYLKGMNDIEESLEKWYSDCSEFQSLQVSFMCYLYHIPQDKIMFGGQKAELCFFPLCQELTVKKNVLGSNLKLPEVLFLNFALPPDMRLQWRFTFSTALHGNSFSSFLSRITNKGPTLIIVKEKDGHLFGGFASENLHPGPNFQGNDTSFLFTLSPKMKIYESTGYNNHFQYLNRQQQTLPNGLGMGGQFDYFGLWIDADFGSGHSSESCSTYKDYKMLSKNKVFAIEDLEVWGVGPEYVSEDSEEEGRSIRDTELEAKAILQMSGRKMYSEDIEESN